MEIVLGRQGAVLRGPDGGAVKEAPTAADLSGRGDGYHLDLPGDPLKPGCRYEQDYRSWNGPRKPVVYAHVTTPIPTLIAQGQADSIATHPLPHDLDRDPVQRCECADQLLDARRHLVALA